MKIITIDTGTTNTRINVWSYQPHVSDANFGKHFTKLKGVSCSVGVRDTAITGNPQRLKQAIKNAIQEALNLNNILEDSTDLILASGMITSNMGLVEVPHVVAPVAMSDLAGAMTSRLISEVTSKPIWFVPGVRNFIGDVNVSNCEMMDMMRGEEVEAFALVERLKLTQPSVIVLPGSHSKFVYVDSQQRIIACATSLSGELLDAISHHTIVANAVENDFAASIDEPHLLRGAKLASQVGVSRVCFSVRVLQQYSSLNQNARANFLMGAVFSDDIKALKNSQTMAIDANVNFVVAGKAILRQALATLIKQDDYFSGNIREVSDDEQADLSAYGALIAAQTRGLLC